jgi:hypothetical protein
MRTHVVLQLDVRARRERPRRRAAEQRDELACHVGGNNFLSPW